MNEKKRPNRRHDIQLGVRFDPALLARIDSWRKREVFMQDRGPAIRALLDMALDAQGVPSGSELLAPLTPSALP